MSLEFHILSSARLIHSTNQTQVWLWCWITKLMLLELRNEEKLKTYWWRWGGNDYSSFWKVFFLYSLTTIYYKHKKHFDYWKSIESFGYCQCICRGLPSVHEHSRIFLMFHEFADLYNGNSPITTFIIFLWFDVSFTLRFYLLGFDVSILYMLDIVNIVFYIIMLNIYILSRIILVKTRMYVIIKLMYLENCFFLLFDVISRFSIFCFLFQRYKFCFFNVCQDHQSCAFYLICWWYWFYVFYGLLEYPLY